jgi:hypothetical protein
LAQSRYCSSPADVAQLVEHFTRNEGVPGSSPGVGLALGAGLNTKEAPSAGPRWWCGPVLGRFQDKRTKKARRSQTAAKGQFRHPPERVGHLWFVSLASPGAGKAGNPRTGKEPPMTRISEAFSYEAKELDYPRS